jgi:hypothetical protein
MATKRKSFRTSTAVDTVEFDIDGEVFHANRQMSAGILLQFADMTGAEEGEEMSLTDGRQAVKAVRAFFDAAIVKEDRERFNTLLSDPDRSIDINMLLEIASWLGEQFTARPTGQPSSSTSKAKGNGDASTDGALPVGTTFSRKEMPAAL